VKNLFDLLFVVFFFGFCIFIHEFGHLLVALWRGLKAERFSIGFGPRLWGFTWRGVEFVVSAIPFGGYVALPQIDHAAEQPQAGDGTPLPRATPRDRMLTAFAGPAFNIIAGFVLALFVWWGGIYEERADMCEVLRVPADSPEHVAGLRPGDRIVAVNGAGFKKGWLEVAERIVLSKRTVLTVERGGNGAAARLEIGFVPEPSAKFQGAGFPRFEVRSPVFIRALLADSAAAVAGLRPGDEVLAIDGVTVENQGQFSDRIRASAGRPLRFAIRRNGDQLEVTFQARQRLDEAGAAAWMIGVETGSKWQKVHPDPWEQFTDFVDRTRNTLAGLAHKAIKPKHMGGPVAIIRHTWQVAHHGTFFQALAFIVFLNFSLGVLNLFPIPVLDGGHILISGVEWAVRRPLPSKLVNAVQTGCAALLIGFMLYITFYDVRRIDAVRNLFEKAPAAPVAAAPEVTP